MKKVFTICFLILNIHNLFAQNCNIQFGYTRTGSTQRFTWDNTEQTCIGDNINITTDLIPNATYQWYLNDKEIKGATQNIYETKDIAGKYIVKAIIGSCTYSRSFSLNIVENINPIFSSFNYPNDSILCNQNGGRNIGILSSTIGNIKYQWQKDGVDIEGANSFNYFITQQGNYAARVSQGSCKASTSPAKITTSSQIPISIIVNARLYQKDTLKVCKDTNIGLSINFSNSSNFKIYKDNKLTNLQWGENITESGSYRIEANSGDCLLKTKPLMIIFGNEGSKFTIEQSNYYFACDKSILQLSGSSFMLITNTNDFTYEWKRNGITFSTIQSVIGIAIDKPGIYSVIAKNRTCQQESETLEVKSIKSLQSPLYLNGNKANKRVELCAGTTKNVIVFNTNQNKGGLYKDGVLISSKPLTNFNSSAYYITLSEPGKYYTIYTNDICTQYSDTVEVIIKGRKTAPISLDNSQCQNGVFNLSVPQEAGLSYAWKKDGKVIPNLNTSNITVKEAGSYSAIINQDFCSVASPEVAIGAKIVANSPICEGQSLQLSTSKANNYEWTGPNGFTSKIQNPNIPKLILANQGQYNLKIISENNCIFKDSIIVKVNPAPIFSVQVPEVICLGKSFTLSPKSLNNSVYYSFRSPDNFSYLGNVNFNDVNWTRNNATQQMAGVYTITANDQNTGCTSTNTTKVSINSDADCPSITVADLSKIKFCYNSEVDIPFITSGKFAANTIFTVNYIDYEGKYQVLGTSTKSPIKIKVNGNYRLIITSNDRNISSSPNNYLNYIYVNNPYIINTNRYACTGYKVDMQVDTNSTYYKYDKFQWKLNGKIIEGATKLNYSASQSGSYSVDVSQNGCTVSRGDSAIVVTIGKLDKPYNYALTAPYVCEGYSVDLTSDNYPKDVSFQWNFEGKPIDKVNASTMKATKKGAYTLTVKQGICEATSDPTQVYVGDILPNKIVGNGSYSSNYDPSQVELCKGSPYRLFYQPYANSGRFQDSVARRRGFQLQWQKDGVDIEKADSIAYRIEKDGNYRLKISQGACIAYSKTAQIKFANKTKLSMYASSSNTYSSDNKNILACSGDSVKLYVYGSDEISYYFPTTIYGNDKVLKELPKYNNSFYTSKSGNYWVTQSYPIAGSQETCIATSDTLNIKIGGTKIEVLSENISTCLDTVRLYNNYQNGKMRWKFNDNYLPKDTLYSIKAYQSGTYQWEINTKNCQFVSKPFTVTFGKLDAILESPYKNIPCYGEIFSLSPKIKSYTYYYGDNDTQNQKPLNPPLTLQWQKDGVDFIKESYIQNVQKGIYSLTIKQGKCSVTTNPVTIDFKKISRDISPKDSATFCPNEGFVELSSAADATYKFTWAKDKKIIPNQIKSSIKASESGIYQTQIESGDCATLSFPVNVSQKTILPTATISGSKEINVGDSTRIKIDLTSSAPWTLKLTNNQTFTAEKTPFEFSVKPLQSTTYEVSSVKNICGEGTFSGKAEVKIIVLGNEEIVGANIKLFPIPAQNSCQLVVETSIPAQLELQLFSLDGKMISKTEKSKAEINHSQTINLEFAPSGTYLLKIIVGEKTVSRKIVKEN